MNKDDYKILVVVANRPAENMEFLYSDVLHHSSLVCIESDVKPSFSGYVKHCKVM